MSALHTSRGMRRTVLITLFVIACLGCGGTISQSSAKMAVSVTVANANEPQNAEDYDRIVENPFLSALHEPRSTFSTSVDTASYSNLRRFLNEGQLPPPDAVRIADMLNYFDYDYPKPRGDNPVGILLELGPCPWQPKHHLLRIALKARTIDPENMPARNFVFLLDTSGSMSGPNRLPLVQKSLNLLVEQLTSRDRVSIVTYSGNAGLTLEATRGDQKNRITQAIDSLTSGGSTNGAGGIVAAYEQAQAAFIPNGLNRVILATDGDFNVGASSNAELVRLIEEKRKSGIFLTVLGYGMGNLKDSTLEQLAHHGNGFYAYIDSLDEARKIFVDQGGALVTVAKDVKVQAEFNHKLVNAYRLIGYENRVLRSEQFRDDATDAGDIGSGHTYTALYEIVPRGVEIALPDAGALKYQRTAEVANGPAEWLTVRMRYKHPARETSEELSVALPEGALQEATSGDFRWTGAVAAFGLVLRDSPHKGEASLKMVQRLAESAQGEDAHGKRQEFLLLVNKAQRHKLR